MRSRPTRRPLALAVATSLCPSSAGLRNLSSVLLLASAAQLARPMKRPPQQPRPRRRRLPSLRLLTTRTPPRPSIRSR